MNARGLKCVLVMLMVAGACSGGGSELGSGGLVTSAISEIPVVPDDGFVTISVFDWEAIDSRIGLESATGRDRLLGVGLPRPVSEGGLGFFVPVAGFFQALFEPEQLIEESGFSVSDLDVIAEVSSPPERFTLFTGPEAWGGQAEPFVGDMLTIGQGEDLSANLETRGVLDQLGRPVRVGAQDGVLAASLSTTVMEGWLDGSGPRYIDDDRVAPLAEVLDANEVISASLTIGSFQATPDIFGSSADPEDFIAEFESIPFISEPFTAVGIGNDVRDGQAIEVISYRFLTDASAEAALPSVDFAWRSADSLQTGEPISTNMTVVSVESSGSVVTVVAAIEPSAISRSINMLLSQDVPFAHR